MVIKISTNNGSDVDGFGAVAYEAYRVESNGLSLISGAQLPKWEQLAENIRFAWTAAALAVRDAD